MSSRIFQFTISAAGLLLCGPLSAQVTQRVSVASSGTPGQADSNVPAISADGRYVAFQGQSANLVPGDTNGTSDVFVRDRLSGTTERVSVDSAGVQGNGWSALPSISADGRYVVYQSQASNLVLGDANATWDIFLRDRQTATTVRVSAATGGAEGNGASDYCAISDDGRYVAFHSLATNLVAGDTNGFGDVFVRDLQGLTTERVSIATGGAQGDFESAQPALSADGRYVVFESFATNLVAGDTNADYDIFLRDRQLAVTERVSVAFGGAQGNSYSHDPSISRSGRYVTFWSHANDLVGGDTNGHFDVFLRDLQNGTTELVSIASDWSQGYSDSFGASSVTDDGHYVAFSSLAGNLVGGWSDDHWDVFVRDRQLPTTEQISAASNSMQGNADSVGRSPISNDGRFVVFESAASNLVSGDTFGGPVDIFVRDRTGGPSFTSLCEPGLAGVIGCPCGNPPSGAGRGCNNSAATGGASLTAAGGTYLSSDSLAFTSTGEKPTALSLLLQGNAVLSSGTMYGQGVRCAGGSLKRLFAKSAFFGMVTLPDLLDGDPTVSARSSAKGDVIQPGQSRWYLVYYRDTNVLGGCPGSSTFNATQTGLVVWSP